MPSVRFLPDNKTVSIAAGTTILEAAQQAEVSITTQCGASGNCGRCVVRILKGDTSQKDNLGLSPESVKSGFVYACRSKVADTDLTIEVPLPLPGKGQFSDAAEDIERIHPDCFPTEWEIIPEICVLEVKVPEPQAGDGLSDFDRLKRELFKLETVESVECGLEVLRKLAVVLREDSGNVKVVCFLSSGKARLLSIEPAGAELTRCGIAIDLGTTSVSVQIVDLLTADILGTETDYNLQISCGADIISRINYSLKSGRLHELQEKAIESINRLIQRLLDRLSLESTSLYSGVISGNTTMTHLLLGLNPDTIRLEPYTPTLLEVPVLSAKALNLNMEPDSPLFFSPAVGSYVGGDITAGLLCTEIESNTDEISLFLDIGTNGELVIGNSDFIMTCACSAGPAFEGGGIECGMRAAKGAIEEVMIDGATGKPDLKIINSDVAKGICGTGLISLLSNLFRTGWIDSAGKLNREKSSDYIKIDGRNAAFCLIDPDTGNSALNISELEFENIIRAKAAIYSACLLMLNQLELDFSMIGKFYIAGGFGRYLNLEDCITIGLLPDIERSQFEFIGNTSLIGSYFSLISKDFRQKQQDIANRMTYLDLGSDPSYMDHYMAALFLPHTDQSLFPSVITKP